MDGISNFSKKYGKAASLLTIFVIWSSIFSMIVSINTGDFIFNIAQPVYAQNNQTEVGAVQKESLVKDESLRQQITRNDNNDFRPGIVTNPAPQNCGINPNAPPCCTPGEDEGCIGEVPQNCGINPNAPPCCTPGEDEGCIGEVPQNCGINPNAPPCCTPGEDEGCIGEVPQNCGINPNAPPCCTPGEDEGCIGEVPQNCGINPNAPPCCTPGEDEGCIGNGNQVSILQLGTNPQNLKPGDEFKVQTTVVNNLDVPIRYTGNMCGGSPLNMQFDKDVSIYHAIACQAISTETLAAHDTTTVQGKGYEVLRAENPGKVNAQVTFNYVVEGDSNNQKQVTESFSFDVMN